MSVCWNCGALLKFNEQLKVELLGDELMSVSPEVLKPLFALQNQIKARGAGCRIEVRIIRL